MPITDDVRDDTREQPMNASSRDFRLAAFAGQLLFWTTLAGGGYVPLGRVER